MASGSIRITNIPISAGGYDYSLGATAAWSTTRSGNTVTVTGKVTTDSGPYSFNSTYAINCTLVWGGDVKKSIVIKASDSGSSIFNRAASYEQSFSVNANQTSVGMRVTINHTNNASSGSAEEAITFPVGWTGISYSKAPKPKITTYPWRGSASDIKWYIYKGTDGTSNAISKYTTYYNRYQKSTSKWLGWTKQNEFAASVFGSNSYAEVPYGGSVAAGDAVKLKVIATGKMGDTVEVVETAVWDTTVATQGFQTMNSTPDAPTFNTSSPLTLGSTVNVKISAKDTSTSYYNNGNSYLRFSLTTSSSSTDWENSSTGTYTNTFTYIKNVASLLTSRAGSNVTLYAKVNDGFATTSTSKTYQCGKTLSAPALNFDGSTIIPYNDISLVVNVPPVLIDGYSPYSGVTTTVKLYISYSSSSGFKELVNSTYTGNNGIMFTSGITRSAIISKLGNPSSISSKVYFKASHSINGFDTVYTSVKNLSIEFPSYAIPTMNWTTTLYRYNGGSPLGRCINSSVGIQIINTTDTAAQKLKYVFTCSSVTKTVTPTTANSTTSLNVSTLTRSKTYNVSYSIYEKSTGVLLKSGTITDSSFYLAVQISSGLTSSLNMTDSEFFIVPNSNINRVEGTYSFNVGLQVYQATIDFYLNDTKFATETISKVKAEDGGNPNVKNLTITITSSDSGYKPTNGYKISGITWNNHSISTISTPSININANNTLKIVVSVRELFASTKTTTWTNYSNTNNNFSTTLTKTVTKTLTATALPNVTGKTVTLPLKA